jgi:hypothetical protein
METKEFIEISFSFTDEFGQKNYLNKTITTTSLEIEEQLPTLVRSFKEFLLGCGYHINTINEYIKYE